MSDPFIFPLGHIAYMPCGKSFWARKNLLRQNCAHPPANAFLIDFGAILRSKIQILRARARRKMRKCIAGGQFGSAPIRLCCHSGSVAVFEAENIGIVSFLISDVCTHESLPFFRDLVISGILTPGRQYDMVLSGTTYDLKEIISESSSLA